MTAVVTRRSEHRLFEPAPPDEEFTDLLAGAAHSPDHGRLRPWRRVLVRGAARGDLGRCSAAGVPQRRRGEVAATVLRAPLLASLVFAPREGHRVPEWEQLAAACGVAHGLMLLLHSRGYGSIWRTGAFVALDEVRSLLGVGKKSEQLLGWLYVGTPDRGGPAVRRPAVDVRDRVSAL